MVFQAVDDRAAFFEIVFHGIFLLVIRKSPACESGIFC